MISNFTHLAVLNAAWDLHLTKFIAVQSKKKNKQKKKKKKTKKKKNTRKTLLLLCKDQSILTIHVAIRNTRSIIIFGLGLACLPPKKNTKTKKKKRVKVRSTACHYATKKTCSNNNYLGLKNIIKLKFTTNLDRCVTLNVLNCLTKNIEPCLACHN